MTSLSLIRKGLWPRTSGSAGHANVVNCLTLDEKFSA